MILTGPPENSLELIELSSINKVFQQFMLHILTLSGRMLGLSGDWSLKKSSL